MVIGAYQPLIGEQAGVVDQQVHVRAGHRGGLDRGPVGDVQRDDLDRELLELVGHVTWTADARVDLARPAGGELGDEGQADAAVRAGDERYRSGGLAGARHGYLRNVDGTQQTLQLQERLCQGWPSATR